MYSVIYAIFMNCKIVLIYKKGNCIAQCQGKNTTVLLGAFVNAISSNYYFAHGNYKIFYRCYFVKSQPSGKFIRAVLWKNQIPLAEKSQPSV